MDNKIRSLFFRSVAKKGFSQKLGLKLQDMALGHAIVQMVPQDDDTNIFGTVHGGAIFSLMDEAFMVSANSNGRVAVALEVNVVFHNPAKKGRRLKAESREIHSSQKIATYEIRVTDEEDVLIASCQALAYRKKERLPFLNGKS